MDKFLLLRRLIHFFYFYLLYLQFYQQLSSHNLNCRNIFEDNTLSIKKTINTDKFLLIFIVRILIYIMRILHYARLGLKKCDLFSTSQFIRYKGQADYKTASGGICSIIVVAVFIGLFMNIAIQTANMEIINWSSTSKRSFTPQPTTITADAKNNKFMFAVTIAGVNLNDVNTRVFDIYLVEHRFRQAQQVLPFKKIPMVPCTQQHFTINSQISESYDPMKAKEWLCPPLGYNFTVQGKWTTDTFQMLQVYLGKCNNSTDPSRPCAPDALINYYMAVMGQFFFGFVYANPIINPGQSNYLDYYLEDRNIIRFTTKLGAMNTGYVQDYSIVTDVSLMPFQQNVEDNGIIIPDLFQSVVYEVQNENYASFFLFKASSTVTYQRAFNKVDSFFSYVGGLIGTILGIMLFMNTFTEMSFELDLSQRLFKYMDNDPSNFNKFNLLTYVRFLFYSLLSFFGLCKGWFEMVKYDACKEETTHQLDIELMLNKMNFLQRAVEVLFQEDQLYFLHLQKFDTLKKLKKRRRQYSTRQNLRKSKGIKGNEANQSESDDKSDESDKNSETSKRSDNNQSSSVMEGMKNVDNSNINIIRVSARRKRKEMDNNKVQDKNITIREHFQRLRLKMEEGNQISKKIFQGMDPIYLQVSDKIESPRKTNKSELDQSKLKIAQIQGSQQEVYIPDKINFEFITD